MIEPASLPSCARGAPRQSADRAQLESVISADVRALSSQSDAIARFFAGLNRLSNSDLDELLHIIVADRAGAPFTSGELRKRPGVTAAAVTYLVDRMIGSGHIRRASDPQDRRKVILRYSDHGVEVAEQFFGPLGRRTSMAMGALPDEDLEEAHRVFIAMIDARDAAQSITLQIIVQAVFGIDEAERRDDYVRVAKAMMRNYVAPLMFYPGLRRAPLGLGPWRRFSQRRAELDALLSEQIARRRTTGNGRQAGPPTAAVDSTRGRRGSESTNPP